MKEIILLKDGEIALKGLNRHAFEDRLIKNARRKLMPVGSFHFKKAQSTIYVEPDREDYCRRCSASPLSPAPAWWKRTSKSSNAPLPHI